MSDQYLTQFENAYEAYADAIFRHLYYRLQNRDQALELTQEVFTKFWQYLQSGKTVDHPKAFLYRSAHNIFVNSIRSKRKSYSLDELSESGFEVSYSEEDTEELEQQAEAIKKLANLPPQYRDLLTMRYVDGLKIKQIANLLKESENTVSVRINRALKKLKELYENS